MADGQSSGFGAGNATPGTVYSRELLNAVSPARTSEPTGNALLRAQAYQSLQGFHRLQEAVFRRGRGIDEPVQPKAVLER